MIDVVKVASYIYQRYASAYSVEIDEMKLHKLLYFTQRESIIRKDVPLFHEQFEAWKYGPVMVCIRRFYKEHKLNNLEIAESINSVDQEIFDAVFRIYAPKDAWSLSSVTHGEYSWRHARNGIAAGESCHRRINTEDIRIDAERVKKRRILSKLLQDRA